MGKIIRNGIPYSGSYDNATSVNYDNSVSGLDARTVQEGIDELIKGSKGAFPVDNLLSTATDIPLSANQGRVLDEKIGALSDSLEWKLAIENTSSAYTIPYKYKELLVYVSHESSLVLGISFVFEKNFNVTLRSGAYASSDNYVLWQANKTGNVITPMAQNIGKNTTPYMRVYYR